MIKVPTKSLTNVEEITDFVRGCTFFGTGGGGRPEDGIRLLTNILKKTGFIRWIDVQEIPDEGYAVCPFLMGSIAPLTNQTIEQMKQIGLSEEMKVSVNLLSKSVEALQKFTGVTANVIVPIELGGANTPTALAAAMELHLYAVDGDYTGRAIPEVTQVTPHIYGREPYPMVSWDQWGNICYIEKAVNSSMAERIGKYLSAAAFGIAGQAGYLMPIRDMKNMIISGTLTECFEIGNLIRVERDQGRNPEDAVLRKTNGKIIFTGTVSKKEWMDKDGYYWGYHEITGTRKFEGQKFKIWFKNENHIGWLNEKPYITSPDMIIVVKSSDFEPLYNPDIQVGMEVKVLGIPARKVFLTEKGLELLGPKHFGFDIEYMPFEKMVETS